MGNVLLESFYYLAFLDFSIFKYLKSIFSSNFPDLAMLQFWSVNYICQVWKLYIFLDMSEILDNIYISVFLVNSDSVLILAFVKYVV